ncbi:hypothetical protein HPG69_010597 [Diceros bicornis minor]|uniref:EF-hand domain-containing protein n=1 Tax=Diceros bicornis minor TaxID=77932 RepID=A0A7J7EKM2_DICBM|nr:hypothetical protein HPG69_010597 [Diceros bicornis minor]
MEEGSSMTIWEMRDAGHQGLALDQSCDGFPTAGECEEIRRSAEEWCSHIPAPVNISWTQVGLGFTSAKLQPLAALSSFQEKEVELDRFTQTCKKMSNLLRNVVTVIDVFYKYTKQDGECGTLIKDELKELLEKEFCPILKNPDDPDTVKVIMHMLDRDHDLRLDFTEFLLMVFKLAMACNKVLSKEYCKASGSKKHRHGCQYQEKESETEEEEENTSGQKSGYIYSSCSEGEEHGGWEGKVVSLAQGTKRDLRKGAVGLPLVTHGVVAKKDMASALEILGKEETSHMLAPLRNLGRNMNLGVDQRVGKGKVMVVCHVDRMLVDMNQTLLSQGVEDKSLGLALEVRETVEGKAMHVVPAI